RNSGDNDLLPGGIHRWAVEMIIPLAFAMMAVRVVIRATNPLLAYYGPHDMPPPAIVAAVPPLTRAQRLRRLLLCIGVAALSSVALYIGLAYDNSQALGRFFGHLEHDNIRRLVRFLSLGGMTLAFLLGTPVFVVMAGLAMGLFFA